MLRERRWSILFTKKQKGWTLIELCLGVAIVGFLSLVLATLVNNSIKIWHLDRARVAIQRDARGVLSLMIRNLREAKASSVTINSLDETQPPYSRISFTTIKGKTITYYQTQRRLYQNVDGKVSMVVENVRNLYFIYPQTSDDGVINLSLTLEREVIGARARIIHLNMEKVRLMNK